MTRLVFSWVTLGAALLVTLLPAVALACPYCGGLQDNSNFYWVLGAMILLPFPTIGLVIYVIKRGEEDDEE